MAAGIPDLYETVKLPYTKPESQHTYTPDFPITTPKGTLRFFIETKGIFTAEDRAKHLRVRECNPEVEIRFVFSRSKTPIYKGSKTTYGDWCDKHGFLYADKTIPADWLKGK